MALSTPTTKEISDNIVAQLEVTLNQSIPLLPKSFIRVLSKALAAVFIILYKYGGFIFLQIFVRTASGSETVINGKGLTPLTEWGRLIGVGDPLPATNAELSVLVTVTNPVGSINSGTQLIGAINGVTYLVISTVALTASTATITVMAVSDQAGGGGEGAIGNLTAGDIVSFANPLPNILRDATVITQTVTGADGEAIEAYRQRVLDRFQKRPQGGAYADYEQWGEETAGILNVYPYTSTFPGQVDVYVEATVASSGSPDGIPTLAQLQAVLDSINLDSGGLATRRPANALVNSYAITRVPFDITITGLAVDNPAQVQADITAAITEYFLSREPYIVGLSMPPRKDRITSSAVGGVVDGIVSAVGGIFTSVTVKQVAVAIDLWALDVGEKAKAQSVTYL